MHTYYVCTHALWWGSWHGLILPPVHSNNLRRLEVNGKLLTTKEAAVFLGVSAAFLERDRWAGATIPFVRVGKRAVRYKLSTLENYINKQLELYHHLDGDEYV